MEKQFVAERDDYYWRSFLGRTRVVVDGLWLPWGGLGGGGGCG